MRIITFVKGQSQVAPVACPQGGNWDLRHPLICYSQIVVHMSMVSKFKVSEV